MTQVINLLGGSGIGKSTTASGMHYELKLRGHNAELVREYVKSWAWEGRKVSPFDQPYIFGKQSRYESMLYGRVDYVVTDSPLLLSPMYETFHTGTSMILPSVQKFLATAKEKGVVHHNFLLKRHKAFDTRGRYEDEATARRVDEFLLAHLKEWNVPFIQLECSDRERVGEIIKVLGL